MRPSDIGLSPKKFSNGQEFWNFVSNHPKLNDLWFKTYKWNFYNPTHYWRRFDKPIRKILDVVESFDVFIDAGPGHPGSEAWVLKRVIPNISIIGLEPHPIRHLFLKLASYPGILFNWGLGSQEGKVHAADTYSGYSLHGKNQNLADGDTYLGEGSFYVTTVDYLVDLLRLEAKKLFIWADIEGYELDMLKGASNTISSGNIVGFMLEVWNPYKERVDDILIEQGFSKLVLSSLPLFDNILYWK